MSDQISTVTNQTYLIFSSGKSPEM